jgi:cytochrome c-type biogenesis protein CcmH
MEIERYDDAAKAFDRAAALKPTDGDLQVSAAEAMVFAAGGDVGPEARQRFEAALKVDPGHPAALYYLALATFQAGDARGAYEAWLALAKGSPPDAPYLPQVQARIDQAAAVLGIAPEQVPVAPPAPAAPPQAAAPGPAAEDVQAAQDMTPAAREAMIRGMVQRLADRLAQAPDDLDGWTRLARAYGVLGETAKAAEAWGRAAALAPADADIQAQWQAAKAAAAAPAQ